MILILFLGVGVSGKYDAMRLVRFLSHQPVFICKTAKIELPIQFNTKELNVCTLNYALKSIVIEQKKIGINCSWKKEVLSVCFSYHKN